MRILQVLPHLSKGGAERVVVELANGLADSGHEVTLLLAHPVDSVLNQQNLRPTIKFEFLTKRQENKLLQYLKIPIWTLRNWNKLRNYDVIHCHLTFGLVLGFSISLVRRITRSRYPRLVATCHMVGVGVSKKNRYLNRKLSYFFDEFALMAEDDYWRRFIASRKRPNIIIVPNGVSSIGQTTRKPMADISNSRESSRRDHVHVGTISRLNVERKPWLFLEVFAELQNLADNSEFKFFIGGDGPEKENLLSLSEKSNLDKSLSFTGLVLDPMKVLNQLDIYVSLNVEAITGIAGLEAVFSGTPVVALQLSPNYETDASDWIWSNPDPKVVAKKIVDLAKHPESLKELAAAQKKYAVEHFSIERMLENYSNLYLGRLSV